MKKKGTVIAAAICLAVIVAISSFFVIAKVNYNQSKEQGYFVGYSIGRTDKATGVKADDAVLATIVAPYEFGTSKWSGFVWGFEKGYHDGYSGILVFE